MRYSPFAFMGVILCSSTVLAVELTGYYKLDDATLSTATAEIGANGTYSAGFTLTDLGQPGSPGDPSGNSVFFPTSGTQKITIPDGGGLGGPLNNPSGNFSLTMWVKLDAGSLGTSKDHTFATNHPSFTTGNLLFWRDGDDAGPSSANQTITGLVSGDPRTVGPSDAFNDDEWHLVGLTFDNNGVDAEKVFIDGERGTPAVTSAETGSLDTSLAITLGNVTGTDSGTHQFQGFMDEVGFWDRELNTAEMRALYFLNTNEEAKFDAAEAAALFDFFELGDPGDVLSLGDESFIIVPDVGALGGIAGQSSLVDSELILGLDASGPGGIASFAIPEPASLAAWVLLGIAGIAGYCRRTRRRRSR